MRYIHNPCLHNTYIHNTYLHNIYVHTRIHNFCMYSIHKHTPIYTTVYTQSLHTQHMQKGISSEHRVYSHIQIDILQWKWSLSFTQWNPGTKSKCSKTFSSYINALVVHLDLKGEHPDLPYVCLCCVQDIFHKLPCIKNIFNVPIS